MSASQHKRRDGGEACEVFCSTVAATLHGLPRDALRELAGRWPSDGNPAERIVAAAMREALCGPTKAPASRVGETDVYGRSMPHTTTPIDTRIYVSPTGERCRLIVGRVRGRGEPHWCVELLNERGMSPIAGQPAIQHHRTRAQARVAYRERLAALKAGVAEATGGDAASGGFAGSGVIVASVGSELLIRRVEPRIHARRHPQTLSRFHQAVDALAPSVERNKFEPVLFLSGEIFPHVPAIIALDYNVGSYHFRNFHLYPTFLTTMASIE